MNIALIAHDSKKKLMQNFCIAYRGILSKNELYATGTTGRLIEEVTNLNIHKLLTGHLGGIEQIDAKIEHDEVDLVIFLRDPVTPKSYEHTLDAICRTCDTHNIPIQPTWLQQNFSSNPLTEETLSGVKCINKTIAGMLVISLLTLTGCSETFSFPYLSNTDSSNYNLYTSSSNGETAAGFASGLCIVDGDVDADSLDLSNISSAALFDIKNHRVLYAHDVYTKVYPASLTKVMTALVALKKSTPDMILTASSNIYNLEPGAQTCGLAAGDTMTLDQALRLLLVYSANDVAIMIAENIGGSIEGFISMMNSEAAEIGATNTNFINSNGLSDNNHYTTVYDLYLIFNEALKNELFSEIINMSSYNTVYHDMSGGEKTANVRSTNLYLNGQKNAPANVTVIGGKTGTTTAAGHCLVLLSRDVSGNPYISIVMRALQNDILYDTMNHLLEKIPQ